jgi:hypothetical protein
MCDKCAALDAKIEHWRKLATDLSDRFTLDAVASLIKKMEAQKLQFHLEPEP